MVDILLKESWYQKPFNFRQRTSLIHYKKAYTVFYKNCPMTFSAHA